VSLAKRIFLVAVVMLVVMLGVSVHGLFRIADVREDLEIIESTHMPTLRVIQQTNRYILEQWVYLDQILRTNADVIDTERFNELDGVIVGQFAEAKADAAEATKARIDALDVAYEDFASFASDLILAHAVGDFDTVKFLLPGLAESAAGVDAEANGLRQDIEQYAADAVAAAQKAETGMLVGDVLMIVIAAFLGLGLAAVATRAIVSGVQKLVRGAEQVAGGDLDTKILIETQDEVGRLATAFNGMVTDLRVKERIRETFGKYMDPRIVKDLMESPGAVESGGQHREMTVMFIGLKGFTTLAERLSPDDLVKALDAYFQHMTDAVAKHGGVVDKFIGDAVMAYWGEPFVPAVDQAQRGCQTATDIISSIDQLRGAVSIALDGTPAGIEIDIRVGMATGNVLVGTVGSTASRSFTLIGDAVNLASRLEGAGKAYGTKAIIDDRTRLLAGDVFKTRELDRVRVKGKEQPTTLFEVLSEQDAQAASETGDADWIGRYESGLAAYRARRWDAAELAFRDCLIAQPNDGPASVFLDRVEQLRQARIPDDWDGVWTFDTK